MTDFAAAAATSDTVFTVDSLLKHMGNDAKAQAIVGKIVRDAVAARGAPITEAARLIQNGQFDEARRIFHVLRSTVGSLGAKRFVAAALALEVAIAELRTADLPALLAAVQAEYGLVQEQADAWLAARGDSAGGAAPG